MIWFLTISELHQVIVTKLVRSEGDNLSILVKVSVLNQSHAGGIFSGEVDLDVLTLVHDGWQGNYNIDSLTIEINLNFLTVDDFEDLDEIHHLSGIFEQYQRRNVNGVCGKLEIGILGSPMRTF